jgi:hypothetical protein
MNTAPLDGERGFGGSVAVSGIAGGGGCETVG